jgi:hypothetical protein
MQARQWASAPLFDHSFNTEKPPSGGFSLDVACWCTFRKSRDVRLESGMRREADIVSGQQPRERRQLKPSQSEFVGKSGRHLLVLSSSQFDPQATWQSTRRYSSEHLATPSESDERTTSGNVIGPSSSCVSLLLVAEKRLSSSDRTITQAGGMAWLLEASRRTICVTSTARSCGSAKLGLESHDRCRIKENSQNKPRRL